MEPLCYRVIMTKQKAGERKRTTKKFVQQDSRWYPVLDNATIDMRVCGCASMREARRRAAQRHLYTGIDEVGED
jgi:hypothetical protein